MPCARLSRLKALPKVYRLLYYLNVKLEQNLLNGLRVIFNLVLAFESYVKSRFIFIGKFASTQRARAWFIILCITLRLLRELYLFEGAIYARDKEVNYSNQPFSFNFILRPFQPTLVIVDRIGRGLITTYYINAPRGNVVSRYSHAEITLCISVPTSLTRH